VLKLYSAPLKKHEPVVCLDERPVQLLDDVRPQSSAAPGRSAKMDYEYKRMGTANVFAIIAPKLGIHLTHATQNRKSENYVNALRCIAKKFPKAKRIHLVQDNLSSHSENCCIRVMGPKAGKKLWRRFKIHFTPKHGSWLNIAESEISLWSRECLGRRRLNSLDVLRSETAAWNQKATEQRRTIHWTFNVEKARDKFKIRVENKKSRY